MMYERDRTPCSYIWILEVIGGRWNIGLMFKTRYKYLSMTHRTLLPVQPSENRSNQSQTGYRRSRGPALCGLSPWIPESPQWSQTGGTGRTQPPTRIPPPRGDHRKSSLCACSVDWDQVTSSLSFIEALCTQDMLWM